VHFSTSFCFNPEHNSGQQHSSRQQVKRHRLNSCWRCSAVLTWDRDRSTSALVVICIWSQWNCLWLKDGMCLSMQLCQARINFVPVKSGHIFQEHRTTEPPSCSGGLPWASILTCSSLYVASLCIPQGACSRAPPTSGSKPVPNPHLSVPWHSSMSFLQALSLSQRAELSAAPLLTVRSCRLPRVFLLASSALHWTNQRTLPSHSPCPPDPSLL